MKKVIYKLLIGLIFGMFTSTLVAQTFEIRLVENSYGYLEVQMCETSGTGTPTTATWISTINFQIRWLTAISADIDLICSSNDYNIADGWGSMQTHGTYNYRAYYATSTPFNSPTTWVTGEWETITSFKVVTGTGTGTFEVAPDLWVPERLNWAQGNPAVTYHPSVNGQVDNYSFPTIVYNYVWTGAAGGPPQQNNGYKWENNSNWCATCAGDPLPDNSYPYFGQVGSYVLIPAGLSKYPELSTGGDMWGWACNKMFIEAGAHVTVPDLVGNVNSPANLNINGTLKVEGTLNLPALGYSTVTGSTTINSATGIIVEADASGAGSFIDNGTITYGTSGTAKVQTYLANTAVAPNFHFHLVGPTVDITGTGVTLAEFNVANGNTYAYKYDEPTNAWVNYSALTDAVPTAKGIGLSTNDGTPYTMEMTGELKTGNISSAPMTTSGVGSYLLSNPYPSSVFWNDLYSNNGAVVNDKVYIYDATFSGGNYRAYNQGSGGTDDFTGYIQVGQGFFVEAIGNAAFTFDNGDRHHSNAAFYKSGGFSNHLDVRVMGNDSRDGLLIHFYEDAVSGYEANEDVEKMMSFNDDATQCWTVLEDNQQMSINALPIELLNGGMHSVPLSFICGATCDYTMSFVDVETFETGTEIWLEDKLVGGDWVSINLNPDYTFAATPQDLEDRFIIHFFGPTNVDEFDIEATVDIYGYRQYAFVRNNTTETIKEVGIYSLAGELLQDIETVDDKFIKFYVSDVVGYYVIRVITDKNVYVNKVFISK